MNSLSKPLTILQSVCKSKIISHGSFILIRFDHKQYYKDNVVRIDLGKVRMRLKIDLNFVILFATCKDIIKSQRVDYKLFGHRLYFFSNYSDRNYCGVLANYIRSVVSIIHYSFGFVLLCFATFLLCFLIQNVFL